MMSTALNTSCAERRVGQRSNMNCSAYARFDGQDVPCCLTDLSVTGAQVEVLEDAILPERFHLRPADLFDMEAEVRWRRGRSIGVRFVGDPAVNAAMVVGLAAYGEI